MSDRLPAMALARPDWRERIRAGKSLMPDMPWLDQVKAKRAIKFFDALHIPDVPGQPLLGPPDNAGADWFREIVGALHGSIDAEGKRAIKGVFCLVPKKNSKTTNAAALMLTSLMLNQRPRATFLLVGATQVISDLSFEQIEGMIAADPDLVERLTVTPHRKTVTHKKTKAKLKVVSFDPKIVTGAKPAGVLVDELHLLGEIANADRVIGQLVGGIISQPEGFVIFITTQSDRPPAGVFKSELAQARDIRDGKTDGTTLPILYEFPEDIVGEPAPGVTPKWHDPALWPLVTPNVNRSITIDRLVEAFAAAKQKGLQEIIRWSSQHLNIEIGLALRSDNWPGAEFWIRRADKTLTLEELLKRSEVVVAGVDGGGLDDLLGLAVVGRDQVTRNWLLWTKAWAHKSVLERRLTEAPKLRDFETAHELTIVEEPDFGEVADIILSLDAARKLAAKNAIGVDMLGIGTIVEEIGERGIDVARVVGISQGFRLNGAIKTLETKLAANAITHSGSALMNWCVGNAKIEPRGNAELITKQASGRAKIDPLMAAFNAVALMAMNPSVPRSYLESDGLLIL